MSDYFDEIADLMAVSLTAGQLNTREEIIAKLRSRFKTEAELRAKVKKLETEAKAVCGPNTFMFIEDVENPGHVFVVPPKRPNPH